MAITKEQVYEAIEAIVSQGEKPTTIKIREHLGTGSLGTINPILKEWRDSQAPDTIPASNPQIPVPQPYIDGIMAMVPQLWTVAADTANSILNAERIAWTNEREELRNNLEEITALEAASATDLETANNNISTLQATIESNLKKHADEIENLTNQKLDLEKIKAVLEATNEQKDNRIFELQANLKTNYENSRIDKEALQAELQKIKTNLDNANTELQNLRIDIQSLVLKHTKEIENITTKFNDMLEKETKAKIESEQAVAVLKEKSLQMQTRIDDFQVSINELKNSNTSLVTELAEKTTAHHAAENRAIAAESAATAQSEQLKDLKQTIKNLQDISKPKGNKV